jgi:hypothetical protein
LLLSFSDRWSPGWFTLVPCLSQVQDPEIADFS